MIRFCLQHYCSLQPVDCHFHLTMKLLMPAGAHIGLRLTLMFRAAKLIKSI